LNEKKKRGKDIELRLISELMKNSRRSDRELAKTLNVSQPTVTRIRTKLARAQAMKPGMDGSSVESRKAVVETERKHIHASLTGVKGMGLGKDTLFITFYKNYNAYSQAMELAKQIPHVSVESFIVDLNDKDNYRVLTMAQIARHVLSPE
jgi:hypothetical protein